MKIYKIKEYFINNPEKIEDLLNHFNFYNIKKHTDQYRFAFYEDDNSSSNRIKIGTLSFKNYKTGEKGDIITLIQSKTGYSFNKTIMEFSKFTGIKVDDNFKIERPFGAYYKKIEKISNNELGKVELIDEKILKNMPINQFKEFHNDGISYHTQKKFGLRYSKEDSRIAIPIYNESGLVGILGRYNGDVTQLNIFKYLPIVKYPKTQVLFGLVENYKHLVKDRILVAESEKSVMQGHSMGVRNIVAIGGSYVSDYHKVQLQSLYPKEIIVCYDKGIFKEQATQELNKCLEEVTEDNIKRVQKDLIKNNISKLKLKNPYIDIKIGYIWDDEDILNDKESIFDRGKDIVDYFIKNKVIFI